MASSRLTRAIAVQSVIVENRNTVAISVDIPAHGTSASQTITIRSGARANLTRNTPATVLLRSESLSRAVGMHQLFVHDTWSSK